MAELKKAKGETITWDLAYSKDVEKAREAATEKMQAVAFFQQPGQIYDELRQEIENNMPKVQR